MGGEARALIELMLQTSLSGQDQRLISLFINRQIERSSPSFAVTEIAQNRVIQAHHRREQAAGAQGEITIQSQA